MALRYLWFKKFWVGDMKFCFVRQVISRWPFPNAEKYCADFRKNVDFYCFSIHLPDLKFPSDLKYRSFHSVCGSAKFKWPAQAGQVPDYIQQYRFKKY